MNMLLIYLFASMKLEKWHKNDYLTLVLILRHTVIFYKIRWNIIQNGLNKKLNTTQWKWMCLVNLFCLETIFTMLIEHLHSFFRVSFIFNTNKIMILFLFCLSLVFHGSVIPCQSSAAVGEHSTVPLPLLSLLHWRNVLMETFSVIITHYYTILWGKNPNASEGSVFLVTCCSLISGSSAKGCLQAFHSFEPFCFQKILLLQI